MLLHVELRGVEARACLAQAHIYERLGLDGEALTKYDLAYDQARIDGIADFHSGQPMPILYQGCVLSVIWKAALVDAAFSRIVAACPACTRSPIGFCQQHFN
jgi:hypothetical protein